MLGGVSGSWWFKVMKPQFKGLKAAAKKANQGFWEVVQQEQRFLDALAVVIARGNASIIAAMPARSSQPPCAPKWSLPSVAASGFDLEDADAGSWPPLSDRPYEPTHEYDVDSPPPPRPTWGLLPDDFLAGEVTPPEAFSEC